MASTRKFQSRLERQAKNFFRYGLLHIHIGIYLFLFLFIELTAPTSQINHVSYVARNFHSIRQINGYQTADGRYSKIPSGRHFVAEHKGLIIGIGIGGVVYRAMDKAWKECTYFGSNFYGQQVLAAAELHPEIEWYPASFQ